MTYDLAKLRDIEKRLDEATEPDRELDLAICQCNGTPWRWFDSDKQSVTWDEYGAGAIGNPICSMEHFTESVDEALILVPTGWLVLNLSQWERHTLRERGEWMCDLVFPDPRQVVSCKHAPTPALALCLAMVRALIVIEEKNNV